MRFSKLTLHPHPKRAIFHVESGMEATPFGVLVDNGTVLIPWSGVIEAVVEEERANEQSRQAPEDVGGGIPPKEEPQGEDRPKQPPIRAAKRLRTGSK